MLLMSLSWLLQQCPEGLACLNGTVGEMGGKWLYNCSYVECWFQDVDQNSKIRSNFFSVHFVRVQVLPYGSTDTATTSKNSHFILSERSDFQMIINLSTAVHTFPRCMLTLFSVDEILLLRYMSKKSKVGNISRGWP